jgi:hypothetical protein
VLERSMAEKYSSKSIDDKRLISTKFNLIYWSEYWLFDLLQLTSIETYLYSTIYEMNSFDVELDSYLSRSHVVRWISRNETLRESFNRTFVLKSLAHFVIRSLKIWAWSLNRWVRLIEDLAEIIEQALLDLRETMRWLNVTYSYSKRERNMILLLEIIVSIVKQWIHWIWKTLLYWISLSNELLAWFFEFSLIVNLLIQSSEMKTSLRVRIRDEKTSWRSRLSFTTVNVFFHARNHASFMREMLVFRIIHREDDHIDRFKIQIEFFVWFFLKFIESDRLSWMRNAVNSEWWMRKWVVKKTKMRCKRVLRLKRRFLFFRFWSNFSFVSSFNFVIFFVDFFCLSQKKFLFWSFRDVVCVKFFLDWFQHYQVWSIVVEISQDRLREEFEIEVLSKMYQVFDREFFSQVRLWRESCRLQSLRTFQCCLHDCMNVDNLSMTCRWLIIANWFCVLCRLATNFRANHDCRHLRSEWRSPRRVNAQDAVSSKIDEAARTRALEREEKSSRRSTSARSTREFHENSWKYRSLNDKCFDVF